MLVVPYMYALVCEWSLVLFGLRQARFSATWEDRHSGIFFCSSVMSTRGSLLPLASSEYVFVWITYEQLGILHRRIPICLLCVFLIGFKPFFFLIGIEPPADLSERASIRAPCSAAIAPEPGDFTRTCVTHVMVLAGLGFASITCTNESYKAGCAQFAFQLIYFASCLCTGPQARLPQPGRVQRVSWTSKSSAPA